MLCPKCNTDMMINASETQVEGDSSPDTPTIVWTVQKLVCRNPKCDNYMKVVEEIRHKIYEA